MIDAELTYRLTRCPLYGFEALHPNRFYTTHVRVLNGVVMPTVIDLHKQRWRCHSCYHTLSAKTPLVQPNHTIAAHMTERIMKLAHERLPVKTIARIIEIQLPRFNGSLTKISNSDRLAGYPRDSALMSSVPLMA